MKLFHNTSKLATSCHINQVVSIMKISKVLTHEGGRISIRPTKRNNPELEVSKEFVEKYNVRSGGYFVKFEKGEEAFIAEDLFRLLFPFDVEETEENAGYICNKANACAKEIWEDGICRGDLEIGLQGLIKEVIEETDLG